MILFLFFALFASTNAVHVISVYGDVHKDVEFFTKTFPWLIDNVGGEITANYYLVGSGRYSIPQMCALEELKFNTYIQAQYLKCEAEGKPSEYCVCDAAIDPKTFKQCVATGGSLSSSAVAKFSELGIDSTPIIETEPRNTTYAVDEFSYLKKICTIFGDNLPRGCIKPYDFLQSESFGEKKALAQFDRACLKEFPINGDDVPVTPTTPYPYTTTPYPYTTAPYPYSTTPYPYTTAPYPYTTTPYPYTTATYPYSTTPRPYSTTPYPYSTTPRPYSTTPYPYTTTPYPYTTATYPYSTTPRPYSTTPYPYSTTPRPYSTTPYPYSTTPRPYSTTPYPYSTTPLYPLPPPTSPWWFKTVTTTP